MKSVRLINGLLHRVRHANIYQLATDSSGKQSSSGSTVGKISEAPIAEHRSGAIAPLPAPSSAKVDYMDDVIAVSGVPEEHVINRRARIYIPAKAAPQSGNNNTKLWKVELDNRERWENPLMGWASTGDPLSNISGNMDFASKEDAMRFCERQGWEYEVEEPHRQKIKPKAYGSNFNWSSRTKIWTK